MVNSDTVDASRVRRPDLVAVAPTSRMCTMYDDDKISDRFDATAEAVVFPGDCLEFLRSVPDNTFQLVVTSPPYNLGKEYEKRIHLTQYVCQQRAVIEECVRVLKPTGRICWQVGNYVDDGEIVPLDTNLNLIHPRCSKRFSGHHEIAILKFWCSDTFRPTHSSTAATSNN
jgi:hypothetical protein